MGGMWGGGAEGRQDGVQKLEGRHRDELGQVLDHSGR